MTPPAPDDLLDARFRRIVQNDEGVPRAYIRPSESLDLVMTNEAAHVLGVERPRIGRLLNRGLMPMPVCWPSAGPIWLRSHIEEMREDIDARRRRPARTAA